MNELFFPDIEFIPVGLKHRQKIGEFLKRHPQSLSGYTLAALTAWEGAHSYQWGFAEPDTLFISCSPDTGSQRHLMQPIGTVSPLVEERIQEGAAALPYPLRIVNVTENFAKEHPELLRPFALRVDRAFSNYLYRTEALARLQGRKYSKKRNLLSQASNLYKWECRALTADLTGACFDVLISIDREEQPRIEGMLAREIDALKYTLTHFRELEQHGLLIFVGNVPAAFSIFEEINPNMVAVHFERALRRFKGLYQVINWETAKVVAELGYEFINREEDLGDPGLRDAKKSYHPVRILPSYELRFRK
ncbi:MAG: DUF2156 domain-containing protein [Acidobacteria bacterium]|nr:DUF2156 domain-containing protein [Acidobacteriota bacterium]